MPNHRIPATLRLGLRWVIRICSIFVIGVALANVLLPAVARAQFAASAGVSVADVLAALVGQPVSAERYVATASTGTGFACNSALGSCIDLGPGTANFIGTNGSGDVLIGDSGVNPVVRLGASSVFTGNGSWANTNGAIDCDGGCMVRNNAAALHLVSTSGVEFNSGSTPVKASFVIAKTIDIGSIAQSSCDNVVTTLAGLNADDLILVTPNFDLAVDDVIIGNARVTNAGTDEVTFRACNVSAGGAQDPASGSYLFFIWRV